MTTYSGAWRPIGKLEWDQLKATGTHSKNIKALDDVTAIASDPGNALASDYMRGMANGLILAQSILKGGDPLFITSDGMRVVRSVDEFKSPGNVDHLEGEDRATAMTDRNIYRQYRRTQIAEMARWVPGMNISGVSISKPDQEAGSPKDGDMIARNPKNHEDKWLVAAQYFADNFEPMP